jgi:hypothetical protein
MDAMLLRKILFGSNDGRLGNTSRNYFDRLTDPATFGSRERFRKLGLSEKCIVRSSARAKMGGSLLVLFLFAGVAKRRMLEAR